MSVARQNGDVYITSQRDMALYSRTANFPVQEIFVNSRKFPAREYYYLHSRTMQIFNFYGLCRIGYGYIDYFLIRIKDLVRFLDTQGPDINLST